MVSHVDMYIYSVCPLHALCDCVSLQTPSERVKAKLKLMLEKTSDKMSKEEEKSKEHVLSIALPSAADIAKIEGDAFEPASFVSHRVAKKQVRMMRRKRIFLFFSLV